MKYSSRKKTASSKRNRNARALSSRHTPFPFPQRNRLTLPAKVGVGMSLVTNLKTSFFANVTAAAGTGVFTGFLKPGSAFDPTGDIAAIQPVGYDQFAAIFNRYKVNKAYVTITVIANAAAAGQYTWVGASYPCVDSTAAALYQNAASQAYSKTYSGTSTLGPAGSGFGGGPSMCVRKHVIDNETIVGASGDTFDIGALVTADPTSLQYAVLPIFLQYNTAGAGTWTIKVEMIQNVTFSQRKNVVDA